MHVEVLSDLGMKGRIIIKNKNKKKRSLTLNFLPSWHSQPHLEGKNGKKLIEEV